MPETPTTRSHCGRTSRRGRSPTRWLGWERRSVRRWSGTGWTTWGWRCTRWPRALAGGQSPDRDTQFLRMAELRLEYTEAGNPIFSMDSKAKEHLGYLFVPGVSLATGVQGIGS